MGEIITSIYYFLWFFSDQTDSTLVCAVVKSRHKNFKCDTVTDAYNTTKNYHEIDLSDGVVGLTEVTRQSLIFACSVFPFHRNTALESGR